MNRLPAQIKIPESSDSIRREVKRLLRAADVVGVLPTPREAILRTAKLVESGDLDLAAYEDKFRDRAKDFLYKAFKKVQGLLDLRSDTVYVDPSLHRSKKIFVTYHEVIHKTLSWQRVIYTEDDDCSLSPECKDIFESEANFGAAEILFQGEKFEEMARDYNVSVASALDLADRFEASAHASIRRFVETNANACSVLVLKRTSRVDESGLRSYIICYEVASPAFTTQFGDPFSDRFINPDSPVCRIVNSGSSGEFLLADLAGKTRSCTVDVFDSGYHVFAMIIPARSARSRFLAIMRERPDLRL